MGVILTTYLARLDQFDGYRQPMIAHWCEGCEEMHGFSCDEPQTNGAKWVWDGDGFFPTMMPSMNIRTGPFPDGRFVVCHYWLKAGKIEYLMDSTHQFAGQTRPLIAIPEPVLLRLAAAQARNERRGRA